jgi:hypothetical protein
LPAKGIEASSTTSNGSAAGSKQPSTASVRTTTNGISGWCSTHDVAVARACASSGFATIVQATDRDGGIAARP